MTRACRRYKKWGRKAFIVTRKDDIDDAQSSYASNLLYVITVATTKIAVIAFLLRLTPVRLQRYYLKSLSWVVLVWTIAFMIAVALSCDTTQPKSRLGGSCTRYVCSALWAQTTFVRRPADLCVIQIVLTVGASRGSRWSHRGLHFPVRCSASLGIENQYWEEVNRGRGIQLSSWVSQFQVSYTL